MILRLVYSFFFFSLVTGNQRGHYGFPKHSLLSTNRYTSSAKSHVNVEYLPDEKPSLQVPRPIRYEEDTQNSENTICFTPSTVHKAIRTALEYVSHGPSGVNKIRDNLDANRYSENDYGETPFDSKTIFQMLSKPSAKRTNLILKYELPGGKEPECRDSLMRLIDLVQAAYLELENLPKCREYVYNFASHRTEDNPKDYYQHGPDIKSLIITILDQIGKYKPIPDVNIVPGDDRYGSKEESDLPIPKKTITEIHEYNIPPIRPTKTKIHYKIPQKAKLFEYNIPQSLEYNIPESLEYNIPHSLEYPQIKIQDQGFTIPSIKKIKIHKYNIPSTTQILEYNIPPVHSTKIPLFPNIDRPNSNNEYRFNSHEYPENHDFPQMPKYEPLETLPTVDEIIQMSPDDIINIIIELVQESERPGHGYELDRIIHVMEENSNIFFPEVFNILINLVKIEKQHKLPRFNDIALFLLDLQINQQWPWSTITTERVLSLLKPDRFGNLNPKIVDIILNMYKINPDEKHVDFILSLLRPYNEGILDDSIGDRLLDLISLHQHNLLRSEQLEILIKLLRPVDNGYPTRNELEIIHQLTKWRDLGYRPDQVDLIFRLLSPHTTGDPDHKPVDIVHFLLTQNKLLHPKHFDFILSFLQPNNGVFDLKRVEIVSFLFDNVVRYPQLVKTLLTLVEEHPFGVLNSRFLNVLLFLNKVSLLTSELADTLIHLLINEVTERLEGNQVKTLFNQLAQQSNPKLLTDVLSLLSPGDLSDGIIEWLANTKNRPGPLNLSPPYIPPHLNQFRMPDDDGHQLPDRELAAIFRWLEAQGLLSSDHGSNQDLVKKIYNLIQMGKHQLGVVELTYMLKHEKPLIYQPVYYVKYRLPITNFVTNLKTLLMRNPRLTANPIKLLQELIVISNVTEVSPNLQGYPKEDILKLTFSDGDLVQAKILDEQNLSLNDQIKLVHGLNTDISPEEILELNRINEAKYFSNLIKVKGVRPEELTFRQVDRYIDIPPVQYLPSVSKLTDMYTLPHKYFVRSRSHEKESNDTQTETAETPTPPPLESAQSSEN